MACLRRWISQQNGFAPSPRRLTTTKYLLFRLSGCMPHPTPSAKAGRSRSAVSVDSTQLPMAFLVGPWAAEFQPAARSISPRQLQSLHRVVDREAIGALGLFGNDGIRSARHQGRNRAVVMLDVDRS